MGTLGKTVGWFASLARAAAIGVIVALCVAAYAAGSLRRLAIRDRARRAAHRARQRGRLLRWSFARLGATFIKVGQVMSSRPDLFSPGIIAELRSLQDRVPPFAFRHVRQIVERELGAPLERRFREFADTPVAAGSVAQVHRAVLRSGDEVAVKVLRPEVLVQVRRDARILLWLAHVSHAVSARARAADVIGHVRNLVAGILAQTDLRHERNNYERFRRNFVDTLGLRFPRVYRRYSTRSMLTMEYIHGARVDEALADHRPAAARVIRATFFAMCFDHGFVHADLHPGNLLIGADGGVVILDVGLVKRLPKTLLRQVVDFTHCIAAGDARDLVAHLKAYHRYLNGTDWRAVEADATAFVDRLRSRPIIELELSVVVGELFALARKHQIRPMPEMTLMLLGMVTNEGMAKHLDPSADTIAELAKYLGPRMSVPAPPRPRARGSRRWVSATAAPDPGVAPSLSPRPLPDPAEVGDPALPPDLASAKPTETEVAVARARTIRTRRTTARNHAQSKPS